MRHNVRASVLSLCWDLNLQICAISSVLGGRKWWWWSCSASKSMLSSCGLSVSLRPLHALAQWSSAQRTHLVLKVAWRCSSENNTDKSHFLKPSQTSQKGCIDLYTVLWVLAGLCATPEEILWSYRERKWKILKELLISLSKPRKDQLSLCHSLQRLILILCSKRFCLKTCSVGDYRVLRQLIPESPSLSEFSIKKIRSDQIRSLSDLNHPSCKGTSQFLTRSTFAFANGHC